MAFYQGCVVRGEMSNSDLPQFSKNQKPNTKTKLKNPTPKPKAKT